MTSVIPIVILWFIIVESVLVVLGNLFTIFVFWKHRNRLKRTSFLLINLTVTDLLVGLSQPIVIKTFPQQLEINSTSPGKGIIAVAFQGMFSFASLFCLAAISLERAFALNWPLRHRVTSSKVYICSIVFVWISAISVGALMLLAVYGILDIYDLNIVFCIVAILALLTICLSYLAIRKRLNCRVPPIDTALNSRQGGLQQNTKISCTFFIVAAASLVFWLPSTIIIALYLLKPLAIPIPIGYSSTLFYLANSAVNPIIYSLRIPIFRETLKRIKLRKRSKQYRVSYRAWKIENWRGICILISNCNFNLIRAVLCMPNNKVHGSFLSLATRKERLPKTVANYQLCCCRAYYEYPFAYRWSHIPLDDFLKSLA